MIDSRACARPARASRYRPNSSGPRWASAPAMSSSASRRGGAASVPSATMPAMPHTALDLRHRLDQQRPRVQVAGGATLGLDVLEYALDLLGRDARGRRDMRRGHAVVEGVQA